MKCHVCLVSLVTMKEAMKLGGVEPSVLLVHTYQNIRCHIPEQRNLTFAVFTC
jgi:hypothetical protein